MSQAQRAEDAGDPTADGSAVTQDYLKAVWAASEWGGQGASITGLARRMGVAPSTASENVARLVEAGLLEHAPYRAVTLSQRGRHLAREMVRRHRLLETYLVEALGFEWDEVHAEAEVLEHAVSNRVLAALDAALGHPVRDPHGDPIPDPDGRVTVPDLCAVESLRVGQTGVVGRIRDDAEVLKQLSRAGIGLDTRVLVLGHDAGGTADGGRPDTTVRAVREGEGIAGRDYHAAVPAGSLWVLARPEPAATRA
ncbi:MULTISPECIES: metal-dependent transcriptional regulator [unclassified Actinomyces]|uniref:metal-dependent transcriptional regulator n=1 Tax=unclassified Actinomyces TaxID=2609248 RepID=UPI00137446F7|nr:MULTISPECIES: metal-dependent transcriptional regulator [unclassified Actinomyces]MBW3070129.1 metal-dependent transcriptional regulator [Actinomyces sp. 594]NDR52537.1 metal-dependent transcriptional regulator [Actinomyces sp. 565]QHO91179.1 iron dependent repressor, metal binding/dimerization domain protein [Actinomyces sp. 432]